MKLDVIGDSVTKSTAIISVLIAGLAASNAWLAYKVLDVGVTLTYQSASLEEEQQASKQAMAVIEVLAKLGATRSQIVSAAQKAWPVVEPFEKDGYTWVGRLGLKFNKQDQLIEVIRG
jgi:predicted DCC family thiol-disulfide oxidoreductase YuxK